VIHTARVGLFRPARTVTGPTGDYWEIYVSKTALPGWKEGQAGGNLSYDGGYGCAGFALFELPFMLLSFLWANIVVPLGRILFVLPIAVVRGRRSRAVRIEAVTDYPHRQVLLWTTTDGYAPHVLDEIVAGLAAGKIVQPTGCIYSGQED